MAGGGAAMACLIPPAAAAAGACAGAGPTAAAAAAATATGFCICTAAAAHMTRHHRPLDTQETACTCFAAVARPLCFPVRLQLPLRPGQGPSCLPQQRQLQAISKEPCCLLLLPVGWAHGLPCLCMVGRAYCCCTAADTTAVSDAGVGTAAAGSGGAGRGFGANAASAGCCGLSTHAPGQCSHPSPPDRLGIHNMQQQVIPG